jgi:hypothetical protein
MKARPSRRQTKILFITSNGEPFIVSDGQFANRKLKKDFVQSYQKSFFLLRPKCSKNGPK